MKRTTTRRRWFTLYPPCKKVVWWHGHWSLDGTETWLAKARKCSDEVIKGLINVERS